MIRGPEGTRFRLIVRHRGTDQPVTYELTRGCLPRRVSWSGTSRPA